ncbi:MAG: enoyl-CoA hydratase [Burkholderiales bacterium]
MEPSASDILSHADAGVLTLTINRIARKNSLTSAMYAQLADGIEQAAGNAVIRAVVLQGHESIFSAGNDIGDFLNAPPAGSDSPVYRFLRAIATFDKPLVAAVCGPAVGIGTTMLLHCDLVYAGDNAAFSMPFVNLGLCPEAASSLLAPLMFGYHRAAESLLLGEPMSAESALEVGLVNRIVPPTEANALAQAQAAKLAAKPLSSLIATKQLMKRGQRDAVLRQMDAEGEHFGRLLREPAAREAFTAFMDKRKPDFSKL